MYAGDTQMMQRQEAVAADAAAPPAVDEAAAPPAVDEAALRAANAYWHRAREHERDGENTLATECMAHFHALTNQTQSLKVQG
jgi:hypothetical protein